MEPVSFCYYSTSFSSKTIYAKGEEIKSVPVTVMSKWEDIRSVKKGRKLMRLTRRARPYLDVLSHLLYDCGERGTVQVEIPILGNNLFELQVDVSFPKRIHWNSGSLTNEFGLACYGGRATLCFFSYPNLSAKSTASFRSCVSLHRVALKRRTDNKRERIWEL